MCVFWGVLRYVFLDMLILQRQRQTERYDWHLPSWWWCNRPHMGPGICYLDFSSHEKVDHIGDCYMQSHAQPTRRFVLSTAIWELSFFPQHAMALLTANSKGNDCLPVKIFPSVKLDLIHLQSRLHATLSRHISYNTMDPSAAKGQTAPLPNMSSRLKDWFIFNIGLTSSSFHISTSGLWSLDWTCVFAWTIAE